MTVSVKTTTAAVLLLFMTISTQSQSTCNTGDVSQYVAGLGLSCGGNLLRVNQSSDVSPQLDRALADVCTLACGGQLANWLLAQCNDIVFASTIYHLCLGTGDTAAVGSYCRYALREQFDPTAQFGAVVLACNGTPPCSSNCSTSLQVLASQIGCCYQSIYNNSDYIQGLQNTGELSNEAVAALLTIGNADLWAACSTITVYNGGDRLPHCTSIDHNHSYNY